MADESPRGREQMSFADFSDGVSLEVEKYNGELLEQIRELLPPGSVVHVDIQNELGASGGAWMNLTLPEGHNPSGVIRALLEAGFSPSPTDDPSQGSGGGKPDSGNPYNPNISLHS